MVGGLDVDCGESYSALPTAVASGLVSEEVVRESARRFLTTQFALVGNSPDSLYISLLSLFSLFFSISFVRSIFR